MPTTAEHMQTALATNNDFWTDNQDELNERFTTWLAK
jgi:hypothetical protein